MLLRTKFTLDYTQFTSINSALLYSCSVCTVCAHREVVITRGVANGVLCLVFVVVQRGTEVPRLHVRTLTTNQVPPTVTLAIFNHTPVYRQTYSTHRHHSLVHSQLTSQETVRKIGTSDYSI